MREIEKSFGFQKILNSFNIDVEKGSIHAVLGENGAGKTTLMNILYGICKADSGKIFLNGKLVNIKNSRIAIKNKIGMVHQHFMLIENFTVLENIILGNEITKKFGILDIKKARYQILEISNKYKLNVDLDAKIENISVGMQQRVEILKSLYRGADILILDEPTAVLTPNETIDLISTAKEFASENKTVVIITHKLNEIKSSSDVCTIIKAGKNIDTLNIRSTSQEELATKMVGRTFALAVEKNRTKAEFGETVLKIKNLNVENKKGILAVKNLSFKIRAGEILGLAGVDGNGQKELVEAIICGIKSKSGSIEICGKQIQNTSVQNVIKNGVSIVHEDRKKLGLILDFTVAENSIFSTYNLKLFSNKGILNMKAIHSFAEKLIENYNIKPQKCSEYLTKNLSGGNQQKIIIAREIASNPKLLIVVQPTRGLDISAALYVEKILMKERNKGKAILLVSFELDEIIKLSDTITVIYNGSIIKAFTQNNFSKNEIGVLMAGGGRTENYSKDA
ncbi:MAG: ABC transporter ATP-binding protein [Oscillospiraceae bacterium]|jgi:simple sugar transport system ATP-binding protein|nr:ABC transporter ATP-binding protein [Oscillospiraceae bacterium]